MKKALQFGGKVFYKVGTGAKKEKFYNEESNNLIVFLPHYKSGNTESVLNSLMIEPDEFITKFLNENENVVVEISQHEQTTSDFTVFTDFEPEKVKELTYSHYSKTIKSLKEVLEQTTGEFSWKFSIIAEGVSKKAY
jgi:hypothetical protein